MKKNRFLSVLLPLLVLPVVSCSGNPKTSTSSGSSSESSTASQPETSTSQPTSQPGTSTSQPTSQPESSTSQPTSQPGSSSSSSKAGQGYYKSTTVTKDVSNQVLGIYNEDYYLASTGTLNVLVCPIEFNNYKFTDSRLKDIKTACCGNGAEDTNYWESLASFYKKSSYGKLNLNIEVMDVTNLGKTPSAFYNYVDDKYGGYVSCGAGYAAEQAVKAYKSKNGNNSTKKFDNDGDGYIDSVILIYSCPDCYDEDIAKIDYYGDLFWAYTYVDMDADGYYPDPNTNSPVALRYFWASYDFFYEGIDEGKGVDAHTLIHEAGHLIGSDDFYNYNYGEESSEPSGCNIMMSYNVCDHDIFSKLAFGWVDPYVVTGDCTLTIKPSSTSSEDNCIILADDWNGTAFDEYVILEYYTPEGLNKLDSDTPYGDVQGLTDSGVRVYHVDNRLCKVSEWDYYGVPQADDFLTDKEVKNIKNSTEYYDYYYYPAASNSSYYDASLIEDKGYELIQLVQAGGTNKTLEGEVSTNADLFKAGSTFSLKDYKAFFPNKTTFNNGDSFSFSFKVDSIDANGATITFTKA